MSCPTGFLWYQKEENQLLLNESQQPDGWVPLPISVNPKDLSRKDLTDLAEAISAGSYYSIYVDQNSPNASDAKENRGSSSLRPFRTLERALIEAARRSFRPGSGIGGEDITERISIYLSPGTYEVENGYGGAEYIPDYNRRQDAAKLLLVNKTNMVQRAYDAYQADPSYTQSLTALQAEACKRDLSYFVDAVAKDLSSGGNEFTLKAAKAFKNIDGSFIEAYNSQSKRDSTRVALATLRDLSRLAIKNQADTLLGGIQLDDIARDVDSAGNPCQSLQLNSDTLYDLIRSALLYLDPYTVTINKGSDTANFPEEGEPSGRTLRAFNSLYKPGIILPRGVSIIGADLRKVIFRPTYIPDPEDDDQGRSGIFRMTGGNFFTGFTVMDKEGVEHSHHKLAVFEFCNRADLNAYYDKVALAFGDSSLYNRLQDGANLLRQNVYWIQRRVRETALASTEATNKYLAIFEAELPSLITAIVEGMVKTGNKEIVEYARRFKRYHVDELNLIATKTEAVAYYSTLCESLKFYLRESVSNRGNLYEGGYVDPKLAIDEASPGNPCQNVQSVVSTFVDIFIKILREDDPPEIAFEPWAVEDTAATESEYKIVGEFKDNPVSGSSPYIYSASLRSRFGLCGIDADGAQVEGFKSFVAAQFTVISMQTDRRAFSQVDVEGEVSKRYIGTRVYDANDYRHFGYRVQNEAYAQLVSCFCIGPAVHYWADSGAEFSITNSTSNFGDVSLYSVGMLQNSSGGGAFPQDQGHKLVGLKKPTNADLTERTFVLGYLKSGGTSLQDLSTPENPITGQTGRIVLTGLANLSGYKIDDPEYPTHLYARLPRDVVVSAKILGYSDNGVETTIDVEYDQDFNTFWNADESSPDYTTGLAGAGIYIKRYVDQRPASDKLYKLLVEKAVATDGAPKRNPLPNYILRKGDATSLADQPFQISWDDTWNRGKVYYVESIDPAEVVSVGGGEFFELLMLSAYSNISGQMEYFEDAVATADTSETLDRDPQYVQSLLQQDSISLKAVQHILSLLGISYTDDIFASTEDPYYFLPQADVKTVEFNKPSSIRCAGQTWEYVGYYNYDTALPRVQPKKVGEGLSDFEAVQKRLSKTQTQLFAGRVYATGMDEEGNQYIGNRILDLKTGEQTTVNLGTTTAAQEADTPTTDYDNLNVTSMQIGTATIDDLTVDNLEVNYGYFTELEADNIDFANAALTNLEAENSYLVNADIENGTAILMSIETADIVTADITNLAAENAVVTNATIATAAVTDLTATNGIITNLTSANGTISSLSSDIASISDLAATDSNLTNLISTNGSFTNLSAANGTITNLTSQVSEIADLSAVESSLTNLTSQSAQVVDLEVTTGSIITFTSDSSTIADLSAAAASIPALSSDTSTITTLTSTTGTITNLGSTNGTITNLTSEDISVTDLSAAAGTVVDLSSTNGTITNLDSDDITVIDLSSQNGTITNLSSTSGTITNLTSSAITTSGLTSASGTITNLTVEESLDVGLDASVGQDLSVARNLEVGNNTSIDNNLAVTNDTSIGNDLTVVRDTSTGRNLSVGANASIVNDATVGRNLSVVSNATVGAALTTQTLSATTSLTTPLATITELDIRNDFVRLNSDATNTGNDRSYTISRPSTQAQALTFTLPPTAGAVGDILTNQGSGALGWSSLVSNLPAYTGDVLISAGTTVTTLATITGLVDPGTTSKQYGSSTKIPRVTVDAKGRVIGVVEADIPVYTPDQDLIAIAALPDTSVGLLKKTAADTWSLDNTAYAPINNPQFTGAPTSTTPFSGDDTTRIATTAFVNREIELSDSSVIYSTTQPTSRIGSGLVLRDGDLWFSSNSGNLSVRSSGAWVTALDLSGYATTQALSSALSELEVGEGAGVIVESSSPSTRLGGYPLQQGDVWIQPASKNLYVYSGTAWQKMVDGDIEAIAALSGTGLLKRTAADTWSFDNTAYAPITSPTFIGSPTATTTIPSDDNSTRLATTAWVKNALSTAVGGVDLSDYALTSYVNDLVNDSKTIISASEPTVRASGRALTEGDLWWQVVDPVSLGLKVRRNNTWQPILSYDLTSSFWSAYDGLLRKTDGIWDIDRTSYATTEDLNNAPANVIVSTTTPTTRPDGTPLITGDLYWDDTTTDEFLYVRRSNGTWTRAINQHLETIAFLSTQGLLRRGLNDWVIDTTAYAPLDSPTFTGTPRSTTATTGDSSTRIATTAFVSVAVANALTGGTVDLSGYAPLDSPEFTGTPTAPTPSTSDSSLKIATTAFVKNVLSSLDGSQSTILISESAPATTTLTSGTLWWNPNTATLFSLYEDVDTKQWVQVGGVGVSASTSTSIEDVWMFS